MRAEAARDWPCRNGPVDRALVYLVRGVTPSEFALAPLARVWASPLFRGCPRCAHARVISGHYPAAVSALRWRPRLPWRGVANVR